MNNGSSAFISSHGHSDSTSFSSSCNHSSRPSVQAMSLLVFFITNTFSRLVTKGFEAAASTFAFKGMVFAPLTPSSAVMTILDSQSLIRPASASGEKPPKTTL